MLKSNVGKMTILFLTILGCCYLLVWAATKNSQLPNSEICFEKRKEVLHLHQPPLDKGHINPITGPLRLEVSVFKPMKTVGNLDLLSRVDTLIKSHPNKKVPRILASGRKKHGLVISLLEPTHKAIGAFYVNETNTPVIAFNTGYLANMNSETDVADWWSMLTHETTHYVQWAMGAKNDIHQQPTFNTAQTVSGKAACLANWELERMAYADACKEVRLWGFTKYRYARLCEYLQDRSSFDRALFSLRYGAGDLSQCAVHWASNLGFNNPTAFAAPAMCDGL